MACDSAVTVLQTRDRGVVGQQLKFRGSFSIKPYSMRLSYERNVGAFPAPSEISTEFTAATLERCLDIRRSQQHPWGDSHGSQ
jgi:hypothetical protein